MNDNGEVCTFFISLVGKVQIRSASIRGKSKEDKDHRENEVSFRLDLLVFQPYVKKFPKLVTGYSTGQKYGLTFFCFLKLL